MNSKTCSYSARQQVVVLRRAAGDDEEEQAPHLGADFLGDLGHLRQPVHVAARDGGLKLGIEADIARVPQGEHGAVEGAGDAAEIVVRGGVGPVQADGHAGDAGILESVDGFGGQQRSGAGGDVGAQADFDAVADQVVEVRPFQRIAAGEDHERLAEGADLVEQAVSLIGGQFAAGVRSDWAEARQWTQAKSQACVTSQITSIGD